MGTSKSKLDAGNVLYRMEARRSELQEIIEIFLTKRKSLNESQIRKLENELNLLDVRLKNDVGLATSVYKTVRNCHNM